MEKKSHKGKPDKYGLEGDGIIEEFFHLLWTKDPLFGTIPSIYVPDTVIIRFDCPIAWYFMENGALRKKNKNKLVNDQIKSAFLKKKPQCGIVATFIRYVPREGSNEVDYVFEYYDEAGFIKLLTDRGQNNTGILQRFIQPKEEHNNIIRCYWGPNLCLFEKIESLTKINDKNYDVYDRAFTFEAENFHSKEGPLRGYLMPNKLQKMVYSVAQHIQNVSLDQLTIKRLILNFKMDDKERIWFLWCSSIRLEDHEGIIKHGGFNYGSAKFQLNFAPGDFLHNVKAPDHINTAVIKGKPMKMQKIFECVSCGIKLDPGATYELDYTAIVRGYEHDHLQNKYRIQNNIRKARPDNLEEAYLRKKDNSLEHLCEDEKKVTSIVPPLIKLIHPKLRDETYKQLRRDPGFLSKTILVCQKCALDIKKSQEGGITAEPVEDFVGTGKLRPDTLKGRRDHTIKMLNEDWEDLIGLEPKFRDANFTEMKALKSLRLTKEPSVKTPRVFGEPSTPKRILLSKTASALTIGLHTTGLTDPSQITPMNSATIRIKDKLRISTPSNRSQTRIISPLASILTPRESTVLSRLVKPENSVSSMATVTSTNFTKGVSSVRISTANTEDYPSISQRMRETDEMFTTTRIPKLSFLKQEFRTRTANYVKRPTNIDVVDKALGEMSSGPSSTHRKQKTAIYQEK